MTEGWEKGQRLDCLMEGGEKLVEIGIELRDDRREPCADFLQPGRRRHVASEDHERGQG